MTATLIRYDRSNLENRKERANKKLSSKQSKTTKKRGGRKANSDISKYEESSDDTDCEKVEKNLDVIQEESHYLDEAAIETLKNEYGVNPFVVAQFPGEAIVLPAGAPFQVCNIKINKTKYLKVYYYHF